MRPISTTVTWQRDRRLPWTGTVTWAAGDPGTYRSTYVGRTAATTSPFTIG